MTIKELQAALNVYTDRAKQPALIVDGIAGRRTMEFIDSLLAAIGTRNWSDARKLIGAEQYIIKENGIFVGDIDGLVGEQTRYARTVYAARLKGDTSVETWRDSDPGVPAEKVEVPPANPSLQWPRQADVPEFYGDKGKDQQNVELPFPFRIAWEPTVTVMRFSAHRLVRPAFQRIWKRTLDHYGYETIEKLRLDMFGGCLNVRKMRGGSAWSMHSWGIAQDVDPDRNQLLFKREAASLDDEIYRPFWAFVYEEGAISLGIERNYDWMHFQFARL